MFENGTIPVNFSHLEYKVTPDGVLIENYKRDREVKTGSFFWLLILLDYKHLFMRKLIAAINMTLDGFCNHEAMIADDELHQHYNELLSHTDTLLFGRITYQLMESYWPSVVKNPTGNKPMDEFAVLIDNISKIVFSRTLKNFDWQNTQLKKEVIKEDILELRRKSGKNILVGSPSLIVALTQLELIDEYQFCVQPIVLGSGLPLFKNVRDRVNLKLFKTKTFGCGAVTLYYAWLKEMT